MNHRARRRRAPRGLPSSFAVPALLLLGITAAHADAPRAPASENWFESQIRHFRSYPHLDRANRLIDAGRSKEAIDEMGRYLAIDPRDLNVHLMRLNLLLKTKDHRAAERAADALLQQEPGDPTALMYRGLSFQALEQPTQAMSDFRAVASNPRARRDDRAFAGNAVVDIAISQGRHADALSALAALEQLAPSEAGFALQYRRAVSLQALQRPDEAQAAYRLAVERATVVGERLLAHKAAGWLAKAQQDWTTARDAFAAAAELDPDDATIAREAATVEYTLGNLKRSAAWTRRALALAPTTQDRIFLANTLAASGDHAAAVGEFGRLQAEATSDEQRFSMLMSLGYEHVAQREHGPAASAFGNAAAIRADATALAAWVDALEQDGQAAEAARALRELLKVSATPARHRRLAGLYEKLGDHAQAAAQLERAGGSAMPAQDRARLGYLYASLGNDSKALEHLEIASRNGAGADVDAALGELYAGIGNDAQAVRHLERAMSQAPAPQLQLRLGMLYARTGENTRAIEQLATAVKEPIDAPARRTALKQLAYLYSGSGQDEAAAAAFQEGIDDSDGWRVRQDFGLTLYRLKRWDESLEQFGRALVQQRTPLVLASLGRTHRMRGDSAAAVGYLEEAVDELPPGETQMRRELYEELGVLQASAGNNAGAAGAWAAALVLGHDDGLALRLGRTQRVLGDLPAAERTLAEVSDEAAPALRVARAEELAVVYGAQGRIEQALAEWERAEQLQPSAQHQYQIGQMRLESGQPERAAMHLAAAAAAEPANALYAASLGHALRRSGRHREAAQAFAAALEAEPGREALYQELAYTYMQDGQGEEAARWFRTAIDRKLEVAARSPQPQDAFDSDLYRMRGEVQTLTKRWLFNIYQSWRERDTGAGSAPGAAAGDGAVPSQGGMELIYRPPASMGPKDESLQLFARMLWTNRQGSLAIDSDTVQAGLGLRWKPLKEHGLFVGGERLVKIGSNTESDWLLRASYGWTDGDGLKPAERSWNYTTFYSDLGYFTHADTWAWYGEARQGRSFRVGAAALITPHLLLATRQQSPDRANASYVEAGAGVSLKYLFNDSRYETYRSSTELLLQYKYRLDGPGKHQGGFSLTAVFSM